MRLTRKIPGIRLPLPGHHEGMARSIVPALPASVWLVFLFVYLVTGNVGLFFVCSYPMDASATVFWMEPAVGGLSLFGLLTIVNVLLATLVLGRMALPTTRQSRWAWKRVLVYGGAVSLLVLNQLYLNGWRRTAPILLDRHLAGIQSYENQIGEIRGDLAALGPHPWAGEYVGRSGRWSITRWLYPKETHYESREETVLVDHHFVRREGPSCESGASLALRAIERLYHQGCIEVDGNRIEIHTHEYSPLYVDGYDDEYRSYPLVYRIVPWDERRYLVRQDAMEGFWTAAKRGLFDGSEVLVDGVLLRTGDSLHPVEGRPTLPADFAHLAR